MEGDPVARNRRHHVDPIREGSRGCIVLEATDPVTLPAELGVSIWLCQTAFGTERFDGVLTAFEVQREPQD